MAPRSPLVVVSWNAGQGRLGRGRTWMADASIPDLARRLLALAPDVVSLQEVRSPAQLEVLLGRLGPGWWGRLTHQPEIDRDTAILTRLPPVRCTVTELPTSAERHALRLTIAKDDGGCVHVVACHGSPYSARLRRLYFGELADGLELLPPGDTVLLAGDFNIDPWLAWLTVDRGTLARLRASWLRLIARRWTTWRGLFQLDHAYLRERGAVPGSARVVKGTRAFGRDHDPVVIELG